MFDDLNTENNVATNVVIENQLNNLITDQGTRQSSARKEMVEGSSNNIVTDTFIAEEMGQTLQILMSALKCYVRINLQR